MLWQPWSAKAYLRPRLGQYLLFQTYLVQQILLLDWLQWETCITPRCPMLYDSLFRSIIFSIFIFEHREIMPLFYLFCFVFAIYVFWLCVRIALILCVNSLNFYALNGIAVKRNRSPETKSILLIRYQHGELMQLSSRNYSWFWCNTELGFLCYIYLLYQ